MKIGAFADVGLRVLMVLNAAPEQRLSTRELSELVGTPHSHVSKVATELARHGWTDVTKGRNGGSMVTPAGLRVGVGVVLRALDTRTDVAECTGGAAGDCPLLPGCRLRRELAAAREAFYAALDHLSMAEVSAPSSAPVFATIGLRPGLD